jgi:ThiF family protein/E2/UBC family protein B
MKHGKRKGKRQRRQRASGASAAPPASTTSTGAAGSAPPAQGSPGGTSIKPWWEREAGRLEYELKALDDAGITYQVDQAAKLQGLLMIDLELDLPNQGKIQLQARFPDFYPYFRFEIRAPELDLPYHQNPFGKQLCVLGRATENWKPSDTLAAFLRDRIPRVLATARSEPTEETRHAEEHQGEPFTDYYPYLDNSLILIDSSWSLGTALGGSLVVGFPEFRERGLPLRGAVLEIRDERDRIIAQAEPEIRSLFPRHLTCRWIKTTEPIRAGEPQSFFAEVYRRRPELKLPNWSPLDGFRYDIIAVVFPEEHQWRATKSDGWVFAVKAVPLGGTGTGERSHYFIRAGRTGRRDLTQRIPELGQLQDRKVVVVGAGALGAPSAIEFARCGIGELRILDHDYVDPGTIPRWPLGISVAGLSKAQAIENFIAGNYPYTRVIPVAYRIGLCREGQDIESEVAVLHRLIAGADLIYDASAEIGINHLLSDLAAENQIPYICVSATYGAWGGRLIRVRPEGRTSGCWMCHLRNVEQRLIPVPSMDPQGQVQPAGCADPTFTGAGFDLANVALAGVRLSVGTLQSKVTSGYPDVDWDVAILTLQDNRGAITVPRWEVFPLERHPECQNFKAHSRVGLDLSQSLAAAADGS